MIPMLARLQFRSRNQRNFRIWVPLILVWLLLLPLALVLLPVLLVAGLILVPFGVNLFQATLIIGQIFCALRGTHIEVEEADHRVLISIH